MSIDAQLSEPARRGNTPDCGDELTDPYDTVRNLDLSGSFGVEAIPIIERIYERLSAESNEVAHSPRERRLKALARTLEIREFLGRTEIHPRHRALGEEVLKELELLPHVLSESEVIAMVRFCLAWALVAHYRNQRVGEAERAINLCIERLTERGDRGVGLLGWALYLRGCVQRSSRELDAAASSFSHALDAYLRFIEIRRADGDPTRWEHVVRLRSILILVGLTAVEYRRGRLGRALAYVNAARVALLDAGIDGAANATPSPLLAATVDLTYGSITRCLAGRRQLAALNRAKDALVRAEATFRAYGHERQELRANYELSLAYMFLHQEADAARTLAAAEQIARRRKDVVWQCRCLARGARVARELKGDLEGAVSRAARAVTQVTKHGLASCAIEASLQLAFAQVDLGELVKARETLNGLLDSGKNLSPSDECLCRLLLARAYGKEGGLERARDHLKRARDLLQHIEFASYHDLTDDIEREIRDAWTPSLTLKPAEPLVYAKYERELRELLIRRACETCGRKRDAIAAELDISRTTLNAWLKELGISLD